jgi:hypothetical protein
MSDLPATRAVAVAMGLTQYFSGRPCLHGHVTARSLSGNCMECLRLRGVEVRRKNPERRKQYYKKNRERERATNRAYVKAHKERLAPLRQEYADTHREYLREKNAMWRKANPGYASQHRAQNQTKYRVYSNNRRRREGNGQLSTDIVERLLKLQRGRCACCGRPLGRGFHLDHIQPLAMGGTNTDDNVQLLRQRCNLEKSYRSPEDFMRQRGKLL